MGGESPLRGSKRAVLDDVATSGPLVVVGYSGRDLDICPALIDLGSALDVTWIAMPGKELSGNAQRVLADAGRGVLLRCTLTHFFAELFDEPKLVQLATPDRWIDMNRELDPRVQVNSPWAVIDDSTTPVTLFRA